MSPPGTIAKYVNVTGDAAKDAESAKQELNNDFDP